MPETWGAVVNREAPSILAVIVLHRTRVSDSAAFNSILQEIENSRDTDSRFRVLLFDNTPNPQGEECLPEHVIYHAAEYNEGIAGAYTFALELARREGFTWMLTLDQDTRLVPGFLSQVEKLARQLEPNEGIGAIVPQLFHGNRILSPFRIRSWGVSYLPRGFAGVPLGQICALNSGSLFRVSTLTEVGGFDPRFWLDYQDYYIFRQLHQRRKQIWVAGAIQVEHDLSLLSEGKGPTPDRFRNFLQAESAFYDLYRSRTAGVALTARLALRLWRQRGRGIDPQLQHNLSLLDHDTRLTAERYSNFLEAESAFTDLCKPLLERAAFNCRLLFRAWRRRGNGMEAVSRRLILHMLRCRLSHSRNRRIREWKDEMQWRLGRGQNQSGLQRRPISVCIATYNGESYIRQQLESILDQLSDCDEVIVVDDASSDKTCDIVESLHDGRIRLERHAVNLGVLKTFEDAIRYASGEIIFLADQDDLWNPEKVSSVLHAFTENPDAWIVVSDAAIIDDNGSTISSSYYASHSKFRPGLFSNLLHCRYLGCTMAFRSPLRKRILPFPSNADVLHDLWIGAANSFAGGKSVYIDKPLVLYRRHAGNATGNNRLPLFRQLRIRWDLCRSLAQSWSRTQRGVQSSERP